MKEMNITKIKPKFSFQPKNSVSFPGKHAEVLYIIISVKICNGNDIDSGHYVCVVLYYNTGKWWNCDYDTITKYLGYPKNIYGNL